jgi:hypothetical protein
VKCKEPESKTASNKTPVAIAGRDTIIIPPLDSLVLDGAASYDPNGNITLRNI